MELQHIELDQLKPAKVNVRKKGGREIADLVPSIRALGVLQPLLVRPNCQDTQCQGFEIVAGQRRYHALSKIAKDESIDPVPCIVMQDGDDAKAIESSLAENVARLPMDELDQYKAFAALVKQGLSAGDIAARFGITERLVQQRLAIANLYGPILTAYRKDEIEHYIIRILTMATKRKQKEWWDLFSSQDENAPIGPRLNDWLFGGADIPVVNALFDPADYDGSIISDLFGEDSYFDDAEKFWPLQNKAIATAKDNYLADGWSDVVILDTGKHWRSWEHSEVPKDRDGKIYVRISRDGEVTYHEGYLPKKEAKRREQAGTDGTDQPKTERPELTKAMQNYLDLHRHAAVRTELLQHPAIALRLAVAQIIAGSELWTVHADPQKANSDAITDSLAANKAEDSFAAERQSIRTYLGLENDKSVTLVYRKDDWKKSHDVHKIFAKLLGLDDETVMRILTFAVAETLPTGSALVEITGKMTSVDMGEHWTPDETFFDLLRDKEAINAVVKEVAGKNSANAHVSSTAKVQKKIIRDCLEGTRKPHKPDWTPRYMEFPVRGYTKRGGIDAVDRWKKVKKHFAEA